MSLKFEREMAECFSEVGVFLLRSPGTISLHHPAVNSKGEPCEPHDDDAVAWSMWDLLFLHARKLHKGKAASLPLALFMEQMRCVASNVLERDVINWQYDPERTTSDILQFVSLMINLLVARGR